MNFTKPRTALAFLLLVTLCASMATKGEEQGILFRHGDWEIVCDNTLTCRMAGYSAEEDCDKGCGSVLITRDAGPDAPLAGKARPENYAPFHKPPPPSTLTLWIDGMSKGKLAYQKEELAYPLTQAQTWALLAAAKKDSEIRFEGEGDSTSFTISGNGITAVLLKMDETQGRIGTPGALARKGNKPEESVFPPRPMPIIRAAEVSGKPSRALTAPEVAVLQPLLLRSCDSSDPRIVDASQYGITLTPLDEQHALLSMLCFFVGSAEERRAHWVIDSALKESPKFVMDELNDYYKGVISGLIGHGPSNCFYEEQRWVWNGREFRKSFASSPGACLSHSYGHGRYQVIDQFIIWDLPTFVSKVVNEDGTPR
jgi:invasion protein IalB